MKWGLEGWIFRKIIDTYLIVYGEWLSIRVFLGALWICILSLEWKECLFSCLKLVMVLLLKGKRVLGIRGPFTTLGELDLSSVPSLTEVQMQHPNSSLQEFQWTFISAACLSYFFSSFNNLTNIVSGFKSYATCYIYCMSQNITKQILVNPWFLSPLSLHEECPFIC